MPKKVIALSADYGYITPVTALVKSIFYHNHDTKVYIINTNIPQEWFSNVNNRVRGIGGEVINLHIDSNLLSQEHVSQPQINALSYGRILIPRLITEDRVLYLDSDVVVNANLDPLFQIDLGRSALGAIPDVIYPGDFNSGVLLLDNQSLRKIEPDIVGQMLEFGQQNDLAEGDQSVLNHFFNQTYYHLDNAYNYVIGYDFLNFYYHGDHDLFENYEGVTPKIIHFTGMQKPWQQTSSGRWRDRWWSYSNLEWNEVVNHTPTPAILDYQEQGQCLTFTNDERLLNIESLVKALPNITFNIAAWTEMGGKLLDLVRYSNVHLYPNVVGRSLDQLKDQANCYLDINYGKKEHKILDYFVKDSKPIVSFNDTTTPGLANGQERAFSDDDVAGMISRINEIIQ